MNKKDLYILTESYPYGRAEKTFIEPELRVLLECQKFNITIISNAHENEKLTSIKIPSICYKNIPLVAAYSKPGQCLISLLLYCLSKDCRREILEILKENEHRLQKLLYSFRFYLRARIYRKQIKDLKLNVESGLFYTYWFDEKALAIALLRQNKSFHFVSRIHGYDLYNERTSCNRQPFRHFMDQSCDKLFFISEMGKKYFEREFGDKFFYKHKLQRLGIFCPFTYDKIIERQRHHDKFLLVSCSSMIPLKRIDYIIKALSEIDDINIKWIHFGAGRCYETIQEKAKVLLQKKKNIDYIFMGHTSNEEIHQFYLHNRVDAFITTSETEGAPVSIQEAMAYGIPVIATAVGEIPFMVKGNGIVLDKNVTPKQVAKAICDLFNLQDERKNNLRNQARKKWENYFDGKKNYQSFCQELEEERE